MTTSRDGFGPGLRADRERAGVALAAIAQSTKIRQSLLVGLENNDLSQWPVGIFRRAFFREYLAAIGRPSESVVADFVRLFPESGAPAPEDGPDVSTGEMRLTLADVPHSTDRLLIQAAAAAADLGVVLLLAVVTAGVFELGMWTTIAPIGLLYYSLSGAWLGRSPAAYGVSLRRGLSTNPAAVKRPAQPVTLRIVGRHPEGSRPGQSRVDPAAEEPVRRHATSR